MEEGHRWWERGVIYQVYPRSFQDYDGDGVGDLPGITQRLEYLQWLGVDAVWISPFYPSPMADFGYDISDYTGVHPMFGTLEDFDALVAEAHRLGLKVILDYVPNHTSSEHPWFVESRSSRENPKRDWYIWRDPAPDGGPPNNWVASFGGGAWERDEPSGQYYYHAYLKEQPDLNWRNPEVREAMMDVLRFWLDRGVDGFRVDALRQLVKDEKLRDNPPNPDHRPGQSPYDALLPLYSTDRPEAHGAIRGMRETLAGYGEDRLLIGELYLPIERLVTYYGEDNTGVHLPFNFHLISTPWNARAIAGLIDTYEAALPPGGWPTWVLGNHDRSRIASRVGAAQARVAAMLLLTLRGTPTIYYGDELGMRDAPIPPELVQDPWEKNVPGIGLGRDPERTPMQWDGSANAGFCPEDVTPWLPVAEDYEQANVATEREDPVSMLSLHRRLLALRRAEPALSAGSYEPVEADGDLLAYVREREGRRFLVALNLGHEPRSFEHPEIRGRVALTTRLDRAGEEADGALKLRGDEGVIVEIP
ncbi:MAG TPA: alpha-amylase family glycosyl hydrolase [Rubrobacteraceae bacterium]|nr:alpha-amylase family glycosyl hydrolase [Rubrobacteraceae bacterium]